MAKIIFYILIILILALIIIFILQIKPELLGWFKKDKAQPSNKNFYQDKKETKIMPEENSIITVYDNYQHNPELKTGWGFSCSIKINSRQILFDTGADSKTLLSNMEKMDINPEDINFVFISHLHGDHTGGLPGILDIKPDLKVYKPKSFSGPSKIADGVWTTGPLGSRIKEQSLVINSPQGLIIITGCAHPGVINIIKKTKEMFPEENIHLVLGGFHLSGASDSELKNIINDFKKLKIQKTAPCHCSGQRCRELFKQEYKKNFIKNGVGKKITF